MASPPSQSTAKPHGAAPMDGRLPAIDAWIDAVIDRHTGSLTPAEFLKAVRALSARYVERRADLPVRSPLDSDGKRAAFAGFFALLHFVTVREVIAAVGAADRPISSVLDLGCGTGVGGAAWALAFGDTAHQPDVMGVDTMGWVLAEARWNWQMLGLRSRTRRLSLVDALSAAASAPAGRGSTGILLAWSANELSESDRRRILPLLLAAHARGSRVLVLEPIARSAAPWWDTWAHAARQAGGMVNDWKIPPKLPARLAALDHAAGFRRDHLSARSIWLPGA